MSSSVKKVAFVLANDYEDIEHTSPVDAVRTAGAEVTVIGLNNEIISGKKGGSEHEVVELPLKGKAKHDPPTEDVGSFTFGYCTSCDWRGRARRSRQKAREDAF